MLGWVIRSPYLFSVGSLFYEWLTTHELQLEAFDVLSRRLPTEGRILDVCCGPGVLLERLRGDAPRRELVGVDLARGALSRAARRDLSVVRGSAVALPFPDRSFDAAIMTGALYLVRDRAAAVAELRRVSRREVVVLEAAPRVLGGSRERRRFRVKARLDMQLWAAAIRRTHAYDEESLKRQLEDAGLMGVEVELVAGGVFLLGTGRVA